jgi:hypothetical protein
MRPQEYILELVSHEDYNGYKTVDLVKEFFNCQDAEITAEGDVWISRPQTPHLLSNMELQGFVDWHKATTI